MNSKLVTVLVVQFMLAGVPLNRQAAAQERFQDPGLQCDLNRKPSQDCLSHGDTARVNDYRLALLRKQGSIRTLPSQSDLLQELLPPRDRSPAAIQMTNEKRAVHGIDYGIDMQETGLLEELLAETAMQ
jgi:hypothetical protein